MSAPESITVEVSVYAAPHFRDGQSDTARGRMYRDAWPDRAADACTLIGGLCGLGGPEPIPGEPHAFRYVTDRGEYRARIRQVE